MDNKISSWQLAALLVLSRIFAEATRFPVSTESFNMQRFAAVAAAKLAIVLLYVPILLFIRRHPGENLISFAAGKSKALGWISGALFIIFLVLMEVLTLSKLQFYAAGTIFSDASSFLIVALPVLVCAYGAMKGIQAVARVGSAVAAIMTAFIITVGLSVWRHADLTLLYPAFIEDGSAFFRDFTAEMGGNAEILIFPLLASEVREKPSRTVYVYIPAILVLIEAMYFLEAAVLGPYLAEVNFPFYILSALSDITVFQRLDGIDVVVWIMACIIKLSLFTLCIKSVVSRLSGERAANITAALTLTAASGLGLYVNTDPNLLSLFTNIKSSCAPIIICSVIIPLILLFAGRKRRSEKGGNP